MHFSALRADEPNTPSENARPVPLTWLTTWLTIVLREDEVTVLQRAIVHLDLDAFFAAVEVLENPQLSGKPVIIGGRRRGVVAAASYAAREYGIRSAMPVYQALERCPQAILLPPRHSLYRDYSRRVMAILSDTTPVMEQMSVDEAYLDVTDQIAAWLDAVDVARGLQTQVRDEIGLSASLGVATNKLLAKVASDHDKPGGLTVVRPGEEAAFLAPLSVRVLWGVGPITQRKLATMGIETVGELAQIPAWRLRERFGSHGAEMARQANGIDARPVATEHERKSVSQERTFHRDLRDEQALRRKLWDLSQSVAEHLQSTDLATTTVAVKLRYSDFTTITRQTTLDVPTNDAKRIYRVARALLHHAWDQARPVRLLGICAQTLCPPVEQLPLL
jgi:DNA polymerase-4